MAGSVTEKEIAAQFDVWKGVLEDMDLLRKDVDANFNVREYDEVVFTGAGSSYHLAEAAAAAFQALTGEAAFALPSSEIVFFHKYRLKKDRKYVAVLFSRSGATTETLEALNVLRSNYRVHPAAVSCDPKSPLCAACDSSFPVKNCSEDSNIMTMSFTGMLFVSYMFSIAYGERFTSLTYMDQLPEEGKASFEWQRRVVDRVAAEASLERITVLGGGPFLGLARECALKLDEVALLRTKVYSPLELRHGPHLGVRAGDLVILLQSTTAGGLELTLVEDMKNRGAKILVLAEKADPALDAVADYRILAGRGIPEHLRGILYVPFIQQLACQAAEARGIDPDNIPGMTRVVTY